MAPYPPSNAQDNSKTVGIKFCLAIVGNIVSWVSAEDDVITWALIYPKVRGLVVVEYQLII
jgi:hypothetical protein